MSDTSEHSTLPSGVEQEYPCAEFEQVWNVEVERRKLKGRSYTKLAVGLSAIIGLYFLSTVLVFTSDFYGSFHVALAVIGVLTCGVSSLWLTVQGLQGLRASRQLPIAQRHPTIQGNRQIGGRLDKPAERQLLEVIERNGEITPTRAALQTSLTVEEAEQLLSDLAQRGHLDVRVEGSKLVYAL